ncbi:hypothetical protein EC988_002691, partial [Linderina pennispora]
ELKAKEKQVLGRSSGTEEVARQAKRDSQQASEHRAQVGQMMARVRATAIDLGVQKQTMMAFEQKLAAGSPREQDMLELERVNGVRALIGLPALPPPPVATHGVRQASSRPGTPMYAGSPVNLPPAGVHHRRPVASSRADDGDDDEVQDMDLEDGELSEDGELAE